MYSFTKPRPKSIFKEDTKLWLIFIGISLILYTIFIIFIQIKTYSYKKNYIEIKSEVFQLNSMLDKIELEKRFIIKELNTINEIYSYNLSLNEKIKNIFDLVPDPITLNKVYFNRDSLIIYGITPSKDIFNTLMFPPLRSLYSSSNVSFYKINQYYYKFVLKNMKELK